MKKKNEPTLHDEILTGIKRTIERYGLIKHPGAETGQGLPSFSNAPGTYGGLTRDQWLQPDNLICALSQPRAALVVAIENLVKSAAVDTDDEETTQNQIQLYNLLRNGIDTLTVLINDNYQIPTDLDFYEYTDQDPKP